MNEFFKTPVVRVVMLKGETGAGAKWGDIVGSLDDQKDLSTKFADTLASAKDYAETYVAQYIKDNIVYATNKQIDLLF